MLLDIIIGIILIASFIKGLSDGFVRQVLSLFSIVGAIYLAYLFTPLISVRFSVVGFPYSGWVLPIVLFVVAYILLRVLSRIVDGILKHTPLTIVNRVLGAVFAVVTTLILLSFCFSIYHQMAMSFHFPLPTVNNHLYYFIESFLGTLRPSYLLNMCAVSII